MMTRQLKTTLLLASVIAALFVVTTPMGQALSSKPSAVPQYAITNMGIDGETGMNLHQYRSLFYNTFGRPDWAYTEAAFARFQSQNPQMNAVQYYHQSLWATQVGQPKWAEALLLKAIQLDPQNMLYYQQWLPLFLVNHTEGEQKKWLLQEKKKAPVALWVDTVTTMVQAQRYPHNAALVWQQWIERYPESRMVPAVEQLVEATSAQKAPTLDLSHYAVP